ncbi:hypothetical protein SS50377_24971 [Spironucleus salmonicida]|uniref:Uncharacterized protein n=1 Tax=Spironucleus salmonicida TaxID=348837 RepID=V6LUT9_9EUKA|nr:hypothetical protein SS50377_24968 [Spironucleus salmonicida]KAH0572856.1 hypothetical protein SS50377_24971 [Spironucleus salmonicida]|eukprot:EST43491.1 Hypothetical protein SS50377_16868 [Spironucleus salmonicida]
MAQSRFEFAFNQDRNYMKQSMNINFIQVEAGEVRSLLPQYQWYGKKTHKYQTLLTAQQDTMDEKLRQASETPKTRVQKPDKEEDEEPFFTDDLFRIAGFGEATKRTPYRSAPILRSMVRQCNHGIMQSQHRQRDGSLAVIAARK